MSSFWNNRTFFSKVYLSAIALIISVVFVAELAEDFIPYITDRNQMTHAELEALLDEYVDSDLGSAYWHTRMKEQGVWLLDIHLSAIGDLPDPSGGPHSVIDILPESDDWTDDWEIVERVLPDGRMVAMGLPEPSYSDILDAVLWMGVIALFAGIACYYLSKFLSSRLDDISGATRQLAAGDLRTRIDVAPAGGDEFSELARLFNKMANSVEETLENERRLLYDISHELRSPLARMQLSLELLARTEPDKSDKYMRMLEDEVERMTVIMNGIMEHGRGSFVPDEFMEQIDLKEVIEDVIGLANFEEKKSSRNVSCKLISSPEPPAIIIGNRTLVEQSVLNLLSNALRYTPDGSQVDVSLEIHDGFNKDGKTTEHAHIIVRDYGPGVPEEDLGKLFRPFFRVEGARDKKSGGIGLGLALASQYIKRHNGSISASNNNPGLSVNISLPLQA